MTLYLGGAMDLSPSLSTLIPRSNFRTQPASGLPACLLTELHQYGSNLPPTYLRQTPANPDGKHTFSEDVLKIEKCGPDEDYLTIIDVPGIFRNITDGVTTDKDKELVKCMVNRYIKDDRTVILAVLPCNVDVATQEILTKAKKVDPKGDRTLGILTKADLLIEQSAKASVVSLVAGNRAPLKLGYHVVTNRGGDDNDEEDGSVAHENQLKREALFKHHPWLTLSEDRRLSDLLGEITDRAFPQLRSETRERLADVTAKLKELGISRKTERQQQQYLVGIASEFQSLVRAALNADYSAHPAFDANELRLITAVVDCAEDFDKFFIHFAHTYLFENQEDDKSDTDSEKTESSNNGSDDGSSDASQDGFSVPDAKDYPDLVQIITDELDIEDPKHGIMEWIGAVHHRSRGLELGSFSSGILPSVFREQSVKWEACARDFVSQVILLVHRFILKALKIVCTDNHVYQCIVSAIFQDLCDKYQGGMDQAKLLVNIERQLKPYTLNHYFAQNQQKNVGERIQKTLELKSWRKSAKDGVVEGISYLKLNDVAEAVSNKSNAEQAQEAIHDSLEAYYKVAYKRFVDNIFSQAVDYKLLSGPDSPLGLFCDRWVLDLEADQLQAVAGESRRTREARERLQNEVADLEIAMKILL
ncbi:interferon-induced GTP-binding protein Mx2 [Plectosphaerella plurivora]|uniref:Interferon-induced GTP-binding protein Mx2 n=1 Tax=Plectosphaerella plurivora TaxID=936078 RepID=A0A9P8V4R0_9PEZI|nr:interferon-induced GTP-binding protein Mx2 [Plectosphaerella plurivora]